MGDGFWKPRMEGNRTSGIAAFLAWLDEDGQVAPFRAFAHYARTGDSSRIPGALDTMRATFEGRNSRRLRHSWRAAVMEVVEGCAFTLQSVDDPDLRALMDELVTGIVAAHDSEEFWQSYYGDDFQFSYQLAGPGHMIQAAVAHHRTTGQTDFLDVAVRVADAIAAKFEGIAFAEHPGIEMALVELWRATGEERIFRLAAHFTALLMEQDPVIGPHTGEGNWRHFNCHVVRQTYLPAGAADLLAERSDPAMQSHLLAIWRDMMQRQAAGFRAHRRGPLDARAHHAGALRPHRGRARQRAEPHQPRLRALRERRQRHVELAHADARRGCRIRRPARAGAL